ncbi:dTDP-3-amino-3,4, 6-trideoxy-alpha-D-glucopyranose [Agrobacterium sp. DSM 25558]|uniref:class I SAM-dependent DNA methyltransferase n=1 Tax=Agrobacterium sp. DSM 25558 TaxID=1907665 RepID=UPI0009724755|nr:class I SAM-dependent methyltransferase [Agrobacterium sp. DSM 25558]SCX20340.1 dTDP-3-amino-3,4, 6-trideoxy-alpha-D-glucopyranose [Agrobacterium sp. DSM 25558]
MSVFANYAEIYDTLNATKDYGEEARFINRLLREIAPEARTLINFGCGTGQHDLALAELGFETLGVELSEHMLGQAQARIPQTGMLAGKTRFKQGDFRTFDAGQSFNAVVSLFHVMSYQISDADVASAFATMSKHMTKGSVALFDLWHGPAVDHVRPETRVRRAENSNFKILRVAEPQHGHGAHVVIVNFTFFIEDKKTGTISSFEERHPMRYFFPGEIEAHIQNAGLTLKDTGEWLTRNPPSENTWGVYYLLEKTEP